VYKLFPQIRENPENTDTEAMSDAAVEVVISGLSGRLPESDNIAEFHEHLINGDDMVTEDDRRWEPGEHKISLYFYLTQDNLCDLLVYLWTPLWGPRVVVFIMMAE